MSQLDNTVLPLINLLQDIDQALPVPPWTDRPFVLIDGRQPGCNAVITDGAPDAWAPFARLGNGNPKFDVTSASAAEALVKLRNALPAIIAALRGSVDRAEIAKQVARALASFQLDLAIERSGLGLFRLSAENRNHMVERDHFGWLAEGVAVAAALYPEEQN